MRAAKLEIYRDAKREWRWRLRASNGRILAGDVPVVEVMP